jgi:LmbE family N-acetylglucosaminyl deacetylase
MLRLALDHDPKAPLQVLCLGAHSDDIEIGCGGAVLSLIERYPGVQFSWIVFSARGIRKSEAECAARLFTAGANVQTTFHEFQDGFLPFHGAEVKARFEEMKQLPSPDLIFTHYREDAHQDHRLICELTWNTFRNHTILEYEIPKYDGDLGKPGVFLPISDHVCRRKVDYLYRAFESQRQKHWFCRETFFALMRLRGVECVSSSGYAEAFYCRKITL